MSWQMANTRGICLLSGTLPSNYNLSPLPSADERLEDALQMEKVTLASTAAVSSALLVRLEQLTACS